MSEAFRSAVAFRNDICDTVSQLQQRFTRPLPNGATVFVTGTEAVYRLAKSLGDGFDDLATADLVVIPSDGTDARWVMEDISGGSPWYAVITAAAVANVTPGGVSTWRALGSTPATFTLDAGPASAFSLDPTTSLLTYDGVPRLYMARAIVSVETAAGADDFVNAALSYNNDIPAGSTAAHRAAGEQSVGVPDGGTSLIVTQRRVLLNPTSTLRLMLRDTSSAVISALFFSLSLEP